MSYDMFQNHNGYNERCKWWKRNEDDIYEPDELIMKRVPTSVFYAKEIAPETANAEIFGGDFVFSKDNTTIKTPDNILGIDKNDLIEYQGEKWIVENAQKSKAKIQQTLFANDKNCSHFFYIELRK